MTVKVEYRDGSSEIIKDVADVVHRKDHRLFFVHMPSGNIIFIPDDAVRKIGQGRLDVLCTVEHGRTTKEEEVFTYE